MRGSIGRLAGGAGAASATVAALFLTLASGGCSKSSPAAPACVPQSNSAFCTDQGILCGGITATDNCGTSRTVASCGTCSLPSSCGGGGSPGHCGCTPESDAALCAANSVTCGPIATTDSCGAGRNVTSCGACTAPQTCGGAGTVGQCGLAPITGKVVDELGLPVATAKVAIVGQAGTQTTTASGTFSFPGLGHAYSIVAALGTANAVEYVGLTRSDPTLVLPTFSNGAYKNATLNLTTTPSPSTGTSWAAAWVPPAGVLSAASFAATAGSASLVFQWAGASSTVNGNVAAFERDSGGVFVRAGSVGGVALVDTQTSSLAVPMSAVTGGTVTGSAVRSTPAQQFYWSTTLVAEIGRVLLPIASLSMSEGAYTLPTPRGTGYNLRVVGTASDTSSGASQACKSVLPDATGVNLSVPLGPIQTAPAFWAVRRRDQHLLRLDGRGRLAPPALREQPCLPRRHLHDLQHGDPDRPGCGRLRAPRHRHLVVDGDQRHPLARDHRPHAGRRGGRPVDDRLQLGPHHHGRPDLHDAVAGRLARRILRAPSIVMHATGLAGEEDACESGSSRARGHVWRAFPRRAP